MHRVWGGGWDAPRIHTDALPEAERESEREPTQWASTDNPEDPLQSDPVEPLSIHIVDLPSSSTYLKTLPILTNPNQSPDAKPIPTNPTVPTDPTSLAIPTNPTNPTNPTIPSNLTNSTRPTSPTTLTNPNILSNLTNPTIPNNPTSATNSTILSNLSNPTILSIPSNPTNPINLTIPSSPTNLSILSNPINPASPTYQTNLTSPTILTNPSNLTILTNLNASLDEAEAGPKCGQASGSEGRAHRFEALDKSSVARSMSAFSLDSLTEHCRICQQSTEEYLTELGCHCRGELAKAHRSCIQQWFNTKGSNKCEVCQHVATNIPPPEAPPLQNFWVWRTSGQSGITFTRRQTRDRFHPLWAALLIIAVGLLFDVLISVFLGGSTLPINIIIGVLVILGIGTGLRLIIECLQERMRRRRRWQMEQLEANALTISR